MATLENRITELERHRGDLGIVLVAIDDDETEAEARERAGLTGWPGVIIFLDALDRAL